MTQADKITVSRIAVMQGRACGLTGDVEARVRGLAAAAVPLKHPSGNRVYGPFVMNVRGTEVVSVTLVGPRPSDERPVSACKLCGGMMVRRVVSVIEGREGFASRPCQRAFDPAAPLCDRLTQQ